MLSNFISLIKKNNMAVKKQFLKSKPICKVTFTVPAKEAKRVAVLGTFNQWDTKAAQLRKLKNGTFKGTIDLPTEQQYQFRYLVDSEYKNDEQADAFVWNDYAGAENGVLEL